MLCLYSSFNFYLGKKFEKKNSGSGKRAHWLLCGGLTNDSMGIKVCAKEVVGDWSSRTEPVWADAPVHTEVPDRMTLFSRQQWGREDGGVESGRMDRRLA